MVCDEITNADSSGAAFKALVHRLAAVEWDDLPVTARRRAALVLADNFVAALSAQNEPEVQTYQRRLLEASSSEGVATLFRSGGAKLPLAQAAMGNALAMGWNEVDEGYRKAICHAGLYVLPALLAVAEAEVASLKEVLRALALGYEVAARCALAWRFSPPLHIHPHALLAPLGAAAGAGILRRLSPTELVAALGTAATLGMSGPFNHATRGVLARNTWAAQGAAAGLNALEWARCGIGGAARSPHDVFVIGLGAQEDLAALASSDDSTWAIEAGYHKLHACCQYAHSTIEAVETLLGEHPGLRGGGNVLSITVEVHPLGLALDDQHPRTTLGAKFSVPHAAAAALVLGNGGIASFDSASLADVRISALRDATTLRPFEDLRPWPEDRPARVTLVTRDGQRLAATCMSARGGPDRPLSETELWKKLGELANPQAPACVTTLRLIAEEAASVTGREALSRPWRVWLGEALAMKTAHTK